MNNYYFRSAAFLVILLFMSQIVYPQTGSWTTKASITPSRSSVGVTVLNGILYAIGGTNGSALSTVQVFDPTTNVWKLKSPLQVARSEHAVEVLFGQLYAVGGYGSSGLASVEVYDQVSDSWRSKAPLPASRFACGAGVVNNLLFILGGRTSGIVVDGKVLAYNPTNDSWTGKTSMPTPRYGFGTVTLDGLIYTIGGQDVAGKGSRVVEVYNPTTDSWTTKASLNIARMAGPTASVINGLIYFTGGTDGTTYVSSSEVYDPVIDKWTTAPAIPTPRANVNSGVVNGKMYVIGGVLPAMNTYLGTVEAFTPAVSIAEYKPDAATVALLHMNEIIGTAAYDGGDSNNNGVVTGTNIIAGRFGKARSFGANSGSDLVEIANPAIVLNQHVTFEAWIKAGAQTVMSPALIDKGHVSGGGPSLLLLNNEASIVLNAGPNQAGSVYVYLTDANGTIYKVSSASKVTDNKWHHVAATYDSLKIRIYVDGVLETSFAKSMTLKSNTLSIVIGMVRANSTRFFNGVIDEVRISSKARLPEEFNLQLPPKNFTGIAAGANVALSWQNGGGTVGLLRYKLYRGLDSVNVSVFDSTTSTSYAYSPGSTRYYYRIGAVDSSGFEGILTSAVLPTPQLLIPTITLFTPSSGPIGTVVTITGTHFNTNGTNNAVYLGTVKAKVNSSTATTLTVIVPAGATYAPITVTDLSTNLTAYSAKPFTVTFSSKRGIDANSFDRKVDFNVGTKPNCITIGDLDGDGKSDLIVSNWSGNTISVFRNTSISGSISSSSFPAKVDFPMSGGPANSALGDLDGDGRLDLAVPNTTANTLSIFRNTTTIGSISSTSFAGKVDLPLGSAPSRVAIQDLDGDGKPDIVATNANSNSISIYQNTSTVGSITVGSFAPKVELATGAAPADLAIADIDGDGKPEIVVDNSQSNSVAIFQNKSTVGNITTSSFALRIDIPTSAGPGGLALGDLDGDGKIDIVTTNSISYTISVLRNTSTSGTISSSSFAQKVDFTTGSVPLDVAVSDLDGDGKPDLATTNNSSNSVSVFWNKSSSGSITSASFDVKVDFASGSGPATLSIGDLDGDGKPDLAVANDGSNNISILRNLISDSSPILPGEYSSDGNTVLLLHMDETSGSIVKDASSFGNHGTATGTTIGNGRFGQSRKVNATSDAIVIPHSSSLNFGSSSYTIESWINLLDNIPGGHPLVKFPMNNKGGWTITLETIGTLGFYVQNSSLSFLARLDGISSLKGNQWHHFAIIATPQKLSLYVDGRLDAEKTVSVAGTQDNENVLQIGIQAGRPDPFKGLIDEIRISNSARSPEEFNLQLPPKNLKVTMNGLTANLSWSNGGGKVGLLRYKIYRGTDSLSVSLVDSTVQLSYNNSNLLVGKTYYYRLSAVDSTGFEGARSYAVSVVPTLTPSATTNAATSVTSTSASLNGLVNPQGVAATAWFEYGGVSTLTTSSTTASRQILPTTGDVPFSDGITGLSGGSTTYFRIVAQNTAGTSKGTILSFMTSPLAPTLQAPTSGQTGLPLSPTLIWYSATGATTYRLQVSSSSLFSTLVFDDSTITGTSRQVGPLSGNTLYYWRVAAKNAGGWSSFSSSYQFTTTGTGGTPLPPKLLSPADGETKQKTTLILSWETSAGASTYRLQVSVALNFGTTVFDDSTITVTSKQVGPLLSNTVYYWRVGAKNVSGFSGYSSSRSFVTELSVPPPPVLSSPSNGASGQNLSLTLSWSAASNAAGYHVQASTDATFAGRLLMNDSLLTSTSKTLTSLAANTIYYWRVASLNISGRSAFSATSYFTTQTTTTVSPAAIAFPSQPTQSTSYRLIGFPGTTTVYVSELVAGTTMTDWRMFSDPGSGNFQEITNGNLQLTNGEGYWLLRKGDARLMKTSLTMPALSSDGTYAIKVHGGWNIISNPFDKSVNWDVVKAVNGISTAIPLYDYNGSYTATSLFEPYKGYYFNNTPGLTSLKIPFPFPGTSIDIIEPPHIDWRLQLSFESDINRDEENYLGIASSARNDYDELDQEKPPLFMDQGFVYFDRPDWKIPGIKFSTDYRPSIGEGQVWDFTVTNPRGLKAALRIIGLESVPPQYEVRLLDKSRQGATNLREQSSYEWTPTHKVSKFSLVIGQKLFVDDQTENILPKEFELLQNYPNPFNPTTTMTFRLPRPSHVRLEILSLLGERLLILVDRTLTAGSHSVQWDGMAGSGVPVSTGVYLYRLVIEDAVVQIKKMTLLR